jgi:predicted helicase
VGQLYLNYVRCVEEGTVVPAKDNFVFLTERKTKRKR